MLTLYLPFSSLQHVLGRHVHSFRIRVQRKSEHALDGKLDVKILLCRNDVVTGAIDDP
jgi:hypothetical protein